MEDRYVSRVAYNEAAASQDPFGFHQRGSDSGQNTGRDTSPPNWDPYNFHNQPGNKPADNNAPPRWKDNPLPKTDLPKTDAPLPPMPENRAREVKLQDGAVNKFDEQGRCVFTASADGRKSREVRYGDQSDPNRVMQVIIDKTRVYTRNADGTSWDYQVNGQPAGTWYGDIQMSKQGEYSLQDARTGEQRKFAANTAELTQQRNDAVNRAQECLPGGNCNPRGNYRPAQSEFCQPGQPCRPYYDQSRNPQGTRGYYQQEQFRQGGCYPQDQYQQQRYQQGGCYPQGGYDGGCSSGYRGGNYGGNGFGRSVVAGMVNSMMYRGYGGYGYGGGFYPGRGYGGGNIGGAIVGGLIGRAIRGGGRCGW